MFQSTAQAKAPQALKLTAALAATSGALHKTLLAVVRAQGVNGSAWLDQLEAQFIRDTKNHDIHRLLDGRRGGCRGGGPREPKDDHDSGAGANRAFIGTS